MPATVVLHSYYPPHTWKAMALSWPTNQVLYLVSALLLLLMFLPNSQAGLLLSFNNTEHLLYPHVSSNYYGTTPETPAPLTTLVHCLTLSDFELIEDLSCDKSIRNSTNMTTNASFPLAGKILVVPITLREAYYAHCGVPYIEGDRRTELSKLDWLCSEGVKAIIVEKRFFQQTSVPAVQDWHRPFDHWPNLRNCDTYRVAVGKSLAVPFSGRDNITGNLSWDPDPFLSYFQSPVILYVYRPFLVVSYFAVACLAWKHLWQRYRRKNLNVVFGFLLVSAFTTMTILSLATGFGTFLVWGWHSDLHVSFQLSVYTQFLGTSIAGDYFTAILYTQLASSLRTGVRIQNTGVHRQFPVLFSVGVMICLSDAVYFILVLTKTPLSLLNYIIPGTMCVMGIAVLTFTVRQTLKTAHHLKQSRLALETLSVGSHKTVANANQIRLERRIRFWVKVTVISSLANIAALGIFTSGMTLRTPQLFLANVSISCMGKIGSVLAQVMIAAPPPLSRVAVATSGVHSSSKPIANTIAKDNRLQPKP